MEGAVLDGGELRIEDEARLRGAVHGHDIAGHGGEVSEEGAEAVDRQAVVGAAVAGLALGGLGAFRLGDDGGPCGVGRGLVVIVEQNRFELLAHVPFDVIGQHAY